MLKVQKKLGMRFEKCHVDPTFAVDGHMTLMDPWRGKKSVNPDGGVEVSMSGGGEGMGGACGIDWAEELFFEKVFWVPVW